MKRRRTHKLEIHSCCCDTCDIVRSSIYILNLKQCSYSHTHDCLFLASRAQCVNMRNKCILLCVRGFLCRAVWKHNDDDDDYDDIDDDTFDSIVSNIIVVCANFCRRNGVLCDGCCTMLYRLEQIHVQQTILWM